MENTVLMSMYNELQLKNLITDVVKSAMENSKKPEPEPNVNNEEVLLTRMEAAQMLHCSLVSLWKFDKRGLLSPMRIGGKCLYRKSDILKSLQEKIK